MPLGGDGNPARHFPPLREAVTTTAGTGVLGDEHGMPAHRRLLAIIGRVRGCEACSDEVLAVAADRLQPLVGNVLTIRYR